MKKLLLVPALAIGIFTLWFYWRHPLGEKALINGHTVTVELALTESEKQKGLGDRETLPRDHGMLFVYQNKDRYGFWMKGMRFPLDYVWIDGNTVADLSPNVPAPATPNESPAELAPKVPVDKVLEVNAGIINEFGIRVGDTIKFAN